MQLWEEVESAKRELVDAMCKLEVFEARCAIRRVTNQGKGGLVDAPMLTGPVHGHE